MKREVFENLNRKFLALQMFYEKQDKENHTPIKKSKSIDNKITELVNKTNLPKELNKDLEDKIKNLENELTKLIGIMQVLKDEHIKYDDEIENLVFEYNKHKNEAENPQEKKSENKNDEDTEKEKKELTEEEKKALAKAKEKKKIDLAIENTIINERKGFKAIRGVEIERLKNTHNFAKDIVNLVKDIKENLKTESSVEQNNKEIIEYLGKLKQEIEKDNSIEKEELELLKDFYKQFKNLELDLDE